MLVGRLKVNGYELAHGPFSRYWSTSNAPGPSLEAGLERCPFL